VEDNRSKSLRSETLGNHSPELLVRSSIVAYGAANLGHALSHLAQAGSFRDQLQFLLMVIKSTWLSANFCIATMFQNAQFLDAGARASNELAGSRRAYELRCHCISVR